MTSANIGINQNGNTLRLGGKTATPVEFEYRAYQAALGVNSPDHVGYFDDFVGDTVRDELAIDLSTSSTASLNQQARGVIRLTTHTDDNANATVALGLHFLVSAAAPIFFRVRIASITALTLRAIEVGLSDALTESNGQAFTSHDATTVAVADDAAIFGYDTDGSMTSYAANSVNGGGTAQQTQSLATLTAGTFDDLGIVIDASGNAYFYTFTGGVPSLVATHASAVATTALLTPWISLTNLTAAAARIVDVDYVMVHGSR